MALAMALATASGCSEEQPSPACDACQPRLIDAVTISGARDQFCHGIMAGDAGELYVSGLSGGETTVGGVTIPFTEQYDGWLVKLQPDGAVGWTSSFTGTGIERPNALALDGAGRVAAAGNFSGELSAAGQTFTSQGLEDGFVSIFDSDGAPVWIRTVEAVDGIQTLFIAAVAFDARGDVLAVGRSGGTLRCDALSLPDRNAFVFQLSGNDGSCNWLHSLGGVWVRALAASGATVAVAGHFSGVLSLGGTTVEARGEGDGVVVLLDPDGTPATVIALTSSGRAEVHDIHIEDDGSMIVVGIFENDLDVGGRLLETEASYGFFALRLDTTGTVQAAHALAVEAGNPSDLDISVAPLGQGRYALAGGYDGSLRPGELTELTWNGFVAVLDQELAIHGLTDMGTPNDYISINGVTGVGDGFWVAGSFMPSLALHGVEITSVEEDDAMLLHFQLGEHR